MNIFKLFVAIMLCTVFVPLSVAQKTSQNRTSSSVSNLIATGASDAVILAAWENLVLQKQVKSYSEAEKLVNQTMQVAFLQGNRHLRASITKTAFYSTLTESLSKEISVIKQASETNATSAVTEKNFKLKPDARDLQRLAGVGKIDLESQRTLRLSLIDQAETILVTVPSVKSSKSVTPPTAGKKEEQVIFPSVFSTSDVILSNGGFINDNEQLNVYLERLIEAYQIADKNLKLSATQLSQMKMTQQQVVLSERQLRVKLLKKAASMIH